jgi:hypothetical protein
MIKPITVNPNDLNALFDTHIKPLYDMNVGFRVRGFIFDNQHWVSANPVTVRNEVKIHVDMQATVTKEVRDAFRAYFLPFLAKGESMTCMLSCYRQHIKFYLDFDNYPSDCFQSNPYQNQNVILAMQVLRERAVQLNP